MDIAVNFAGPARAFGNPLTNADLAHVVKKRRVVEVCFIFRGLGLRAALQAAHNNGMADDATLCAAIRTEQQVIAAHPNVLGGVATAAGLAAVAAQIAGIAERFDAIPAMLDARDSRRINRQPAANRGGVVQALPRLRRTPLGAPPPAGGLGGADPDPGNEACWWDAVGC